MKNTPIVVWVLVAILVAGVAFFAGTKYQLRKQAATQTRQGVNGIRSGPGGQFRNGGNAVNGEILTVDDKSISVKLPDGSSKVVLLSGSVTISKAAEGTKSDLKVGERVIVFGTTNSDGSVTATNISLNPAMRPSPTPTSGQ